MKIILLQDVRGVGKKDDVREVKDGYGRNFLLARGLAKPATPNALKELTRRRQETAEEEHEAIIRLGNLAKKLSERKLEFTLKSDAHGSVFGSVSKEAILREIRHHFAHHDRPAITLEHPLKQFGDFKIPVQLGMGMSTEITVSVRPEE